MEPGLHRVRARIDQRLGAIRRGDVAGSDLRVIAFALDARNRFQHAFGMAMRGVDHHNVTFGLDERHGAPQTIVADIGGGGHAQAAAFILTGVGKFLRLLDVFHGNEADAAVVFVYHQNLFDAVLMQKPLGFLHLHAFAHGDELVLRHQLGDRLALVGGETHIAVSEDADELARAIFRTFHHRNTGDAIALHQFERIGERGVRPDGDRVHHHAAFEFLHAADMFGLFLDGEIAVDHAHAASLGHGDGEARFRDGIHGGGDERDAELDRFGEARAGIDLRGQNFGSAGHQQNIVEGQSFTDGGALFHAGVYQPCPYFARVRNIPQR